MYIIIDQKVPHLLHVRYVMGSNLCQNHVINKDFEIYNCCYLVRRAIYVDSKSRGGMHWPKIAVTQYHTQ